MGAACEGRGFNHHMHFTLLEPFDLALDLDSGIHGRHVDQYLKVRPLWR